jgi:hypothetical protein
LISRLKYRRTKSESATAFSTPGITIDHQPTTNNQRPTTKINAAQASHLGRLLVDVRTALLPLRAATGVRLNRLPEGRGSRVAPCTSLIEKSAIRSDYLKLTAQSAFEGGPFEEAATPGYPGTRRSASLEPFRQFTLENRRLPPASL